MREVGEISKHLSGDINKAATYIQLARNKLGALKEGMKAHGLHQNTDTLTIDGGVVITVTSRFGIDSVEIYAPEKVVKKEVVEDIDEPEISATRYYSFDINIYTYRTRCDGSCKSVSSSGGGGYMLLYVFLIPSEATIKFMARIFKRLPRPYYIGGAFLFEYTTKDGEKRERDFYYEDFHYTDISHSSAYATIPADVRGTPIDDSSCDPNTIDSVSCDDGAVDRSWKLESDKWIYCPAGDYYEGNEEYGYTEYEGDFVDGSKAKLIAVRESSSSEWLYLDDDEDYERMQTIG